MNLLDSLKWRYATKVFDKNKKVSETDLAEILEAFRLTPSAYWLQPWKLIIVENPELRQKLLPVSWNQSQIVDASHLLVLARRDDLWDSFVDEYVEDFTKTRGIQKQDIAWYESMMKSFISSLSLEAKTSWATRQVFIALWNILTFLASKEIDSCPMEWFDSKAYDEILWLKDLSLSSVAVLPIGYRSEDDKYITYPKVRFSLDDIVLKM